MLCEHGEGVVLVYKNTIIVCKRLSINQLEKNRVRENMPK